MSATCGGNGMSATCDANGIPPVMGIVKAPLGSSSNTAAATIKTTSLDFIVSFQTLNDPA
jgi:hypothetical protein